jgi:hypothetical protein
VIIRHRLFQAHRDEFGHAEATESCRRWSAPPRFIVRPDLFGRVAGGNSRWCCATPYPGSRATWPTHSRLPPSACASADIRGDREFGVAAQSGVVDTTDALQRAAAAGIVPEPRSKPHCDRPDAAGDAILLQPHGWPDRARDC